MENRINVLVYPCGNEGGLEIHAALKDVVNVDLYGASGKKDHGKFVFQNYIGEAPYIKEEKFADSFNAIVHRCGIHVIIPTHDDISLALAQNASAIDARIAVPGIRQAEICRSKLATYQLFKDEPFCPEVFAGLSSVTQFPAFAKPDKGQGGKGSFIINREDEFPEERIAQGDLILTEYLPGDELTVDCFSDRHGKLRFAGPRKRNRVFGGISVSSFVVPLSKEIETIAAKINEKVGMRGLWYFQLKQDVSGKYKLLEISVRIAGCMNLYRGLGINFPLLTVYDQMDYDIEILRNDYYLEVDRALSNRYKPALDYETIYIDFDDTITRRGRVNPFVMLFLYHARNSGKKIKLLTKHEYDLSASLSRLSIHPSLFDEIILLGLNDEKSQKITETEKVIFIDNAYKERAQVRRKLNIPVFDVDAINTLIDWRE